MARAGEFLAGMTRWSQPMELLTLFLLALVAFGMAIQFTPADMLQRHVSRRLSDRLDGIQHGPEGSIDKLLMTWTEQTVGDAALAIGGCAHDGTDPTWLNTYLYSRAQSVMGGTSQIQRNLIAGMMGHKVS